MNKNPPVIVIVGPTGSGKTEVSIQLAKSLNGEIISADSRQFFTGMNIGTAKPTNAQMATIRHHLINIVDPTRLWSLTDFQEAARKCIIEIYARDKIPFIVGGTGQYVWGLIEGWQVPSQPVNRELRHILEAWAEEIGALKFHRVLQMLDKRAAEIVQPQNVRRTIRALEVILSSGKKFSDQRSKQPPGEEFVILGIAWDRPELYRRIDLRIEIMLNTGLVEEVSNLLNLGYDPDSSALSAIGYREIIDYLNGKHSLDEAVVLIKRNTRQYIRRQANWFKPSDPRINWFQAGEELAERMELFLKQKFLDLNRQVS